MTTEKQENTGSITRATGLLVIVVENSNPNGDPDQESDPRRRSHDQRGMITGVSFKRKVRDLILQKDGAVWPKIAAKLGIAQLNGQWEREGYAFDIFECREDGDHLQKDIKKLVKENPDGFKKRFWDGGVFGNTLLEEGVGDTIRSGVAQFGLAVSVAPIRVHRLTKTKMAPAQEGTTRGMAPLGHRVVEHAVYCMPFFVNPTGARQARNGLHAARHPFAAETHPIRLPAHQVRHPAARRGKTRVVRRARRRSRLVLGI